MSSTETRAGGRAVGVPVAGQVRCQQRSLEGHGHRVPGVGVLRATVQEHELGGVLSPDERTELPARRQLHRLPAHRRGAAVGEVELLGVLVEQAKLVVLDACHLWHRSRELQGSNHQRRASAAPGSPGGGRMGP